MGCTRWHRRCTPSRGWRGRTHGGVEVTRARAEESRMANNVAEKAIKQGIKAYLRVSRWAATPRRSIGGAISRLIDEAKQEMGAGPAETRALPPAGGTTASTGAAASGAGAAATATGRAVRSATSPREVGHGSSAGLETVDDAPAHVSSPQVDHEAVGRGTRRGRSASGGTGTGRASHTGRGAGGSRSSTSRNAAAAATGARRRQSGTGASTADTSGGGSSAIPERAGSTATSGGAGGSGGSGGGATGAGGGGSTGDSAASGSSGTTATSTPGGAPTGSESPGSGERGPVDPAPDV